MMGGGTLLINSSHFEQNFADGPGGCFYIDASARFTSEYNTHHGSESKGAGAALYAAQGVVVDGHKMYVHPPPSPAQRMFLRRLNEKTKRVVAVICAWAPTGTYITEGSR